MLELWSGGEYIATPHRVVNRSEHERYSFPFFVVPNHDVVVEPLPPPSRPHQTDAVGALSAEVWRTNWPDGHHRPPVTTSAARPHMTASPIDGVIANPPAPWRCSHTPTSSAPDEWPRRRDRCRTPGCRCFSLNATAASAATSPRSGSRLRLVSPRTDPGFRGHRHRVRGASEGGGAAPSNPERQPRPRRRGVQERRRRHGRRRDQPLSTPWSSPRSSRTTRSSA